MEAGLLFKIANSVAMLGWLLMFIIPYHKITRKVIHSGLLPVLLSALYFVIMATTLGSAEGSFASLEGVKKLFTHDYAVLGGWVHYLAFDMFVGSWELQDAEHRNISRIIMIPILFFTFMLGPIGYLAYKALIWFKTGRSKEDTPGRKLELT